jgi:hypothetical protein
VAAKWRTKPFWNNGRKKKKKKEKLKERIWRRVRGAKALQALRSLY